MRVLGLDTSTLAASAALMEDFHLLADYFLDDGISHSRKVLPLIDFLLAQAHLKLQDIDGFCVAAGPGSFTGLRIGLSVIKGLSLATGKTAVGVPTLEAMALTKVHVDKQVCPVIDARKKEVYCALFVIEGEALRRVTEDMVLEPEALCELIKEPTLFTGDGIRAYGDLFRSRLGEKAILHEHFSGVSTAAQVARLGQEMLHSGRAAKEVEPIYIRPSEAELKHGQRSAVTVSGSKRGA